MSARSFRFPASCFYHLFFLQLASLSAFLFVYPQSPDSANAQSGWNLNLSNTLYHLYTESSDSKDISLLGSANELVLNYRNSADAYSVELERQNISFDDYNKLNNLQFSFISDYRRIHFQYSRLQNMLTFSAGIEFIETQDQRICNYQSAIGIAFQKQSLPNFEVRINSSHIPFTFRSTYLTERLDIINPASFLSLEQWWRYTQGRTIFAIGYLRAYPQPEDKRLLFSLKDHSTIEGWQSQINYDDKSSRYLLHFQNIDYKSNIDLNDQGLQYSNINVTNFSFYNLRLEYSGDLPNGKKIIIGGDYFYCDGKLVGHIESWPFSSVIQSLFINRLYFRAAGTINVQAVDCSLSIPEGRFKIIPALSLFRVKPELQIETWRPEFLVFGLTDYTNSTLDIKEAGLALLKVQVQYNPAMMRFAFEANQIIPIYTVKTSRPAAANPVTTAPGRHIVDGGRWFTLSLGIPFAE